MGTMQHFLGRDPALYETCSEETKNNTIKKVLELIEEGISFEAACWGAEVDPELFDQWRNDNPRVHQRVMVALSKLERALVREVRAGGRGLSAAKASLEVLERLFKAWARKSSVSLVANFQEALAELKKQLPPEHYQTVVATLKKFS
jgi:hypothetical protein